MVKTKKGIKMGNSSDSCGSSEATFRLSFPSSFTARREPLDEESLTTPTSSAQVKVENDVREEYLKFFKTAFHNPDAPELLRSVHAQFLFKHLKEPMPGKYAVLDCNKTWLCYWITHSLYVLEEEINDDIKSNLVSFLADCQCESGGFSGGPGQFAHLAPTYSAMNTVCILGTEEGYDMVNREALLRFLWSLKQSNGSFRMHIGGEVDIRSAYCAVVVATITGIISEELFEGTAEWVASCQTYEGGFSGAPGMEAHGGYTFCGIAALVLLGKTDLVDLDSLLRWTVCRQMKLEGGFQGRTNKLVDSCYSFWQGAGSLLACTALSNQTGFSPPDGPILFEGKHLEEYILICCQHVQGGIKDKPSTNRDCYHTCYALSGLALVSNYAGTSEILNDRRLSLPFIDPVYNVGSDFIQKAVLYFSKLEKPKHQPD